MREVPFSRGAPTARTVRRTRFPVAAACGVGPFADGPGRPEKRWRRPGEPTTAESMAATTVRWMAGAADCNAAAVLRCNATTTAAAPTGRPRTWVRHCCDHWGRLFGRD